MNLLVLALALLSAGSVLALLAGRWPRLAGGIAVATTWGAAAVGIGPVIAALQGESIPSLDIAWNVPAGKILLALDPLSAIFALPVLLLPALAAIYGIGSLAGQDDDGERRGGSLWFFYCLLSAAMLLVTLARNGLLFLVAWEVMSVASYFLVVHDDEREEVRQAGYTYLVATHLGTAFLLAYFALWGGFTGSLDFLASSAAVDPARASLLFLLALVGFGTKAGLMPLHVWMPEAYPAAPSHVAAVMSGVMINMGLYGLFRTIALVGHPQEWWAWLLIAIGCLSAILGILLALAQQDLKRLLAYSSVENAGIITLGLGIGLLGLQIRHPASSAAITALGFGGALLHIWNHTLMKSLLFLGAGAVLHGAGTRQLDRLGGLFKRMPWTGSCFLIAAVAICGLPPLCGFMSEFLIYLGAFQDDVSEGTAHAVPSLAIIGSLALAGGLAAYAFTKAFGIAFLGEPRSAEAAAAEEANGWMRVPQVVLAAGCVALGLSAGRVAPYLAPAVAQMGSLPETAAAAALGDVAGLVTTIACLAGVLAGGVLLLAILRGSLLGAREVGETGTWDCGFAAPTVRMQYTATSFAQPAMELFSLAVRSQIALAPPEGLFPQAASFAARTPDAVQAGVIEPAWEQFSGALSWLRWVQHGQLHLYVLYVAATLGILLTALVMGWVK